MSLSRSVLYGVRIPAGWALEALILALAVMLPAVATAQTALGCGENLAGTIDSAGAVRFYTLQGIGQGDSLFLSVVTSDPLPVQPQGFRPRLELYNGAGIMIGSAQATSQTAEMDLLLTTAGPYTLAVREADNAYSGAYRLSLQRINNPCNATTLSCGTVARGAFTELSQISAFVLDGVAAGDAVNFAHSGGDLRVYDASTGQILYPAFEGIYRFVSPSPRYLLTTAGPFTVLINGGAVSDSAWRLAMQIFNRPCARTPISCGEAVNTTVGELGETDYYALPGLAADGVYRITLVRTDASQAAPTLSLEAFDASGALFLFAHNRGFFMPPTAPSASVTFSGSPTTVFIRAWPWSSGAFSAVPYRLLLERVNGPCNASLLSCGQSHQSSIGTIGDADAYTLGSVGPGDRIAVRMTHGASAVSPQFELFDGVGTRIGLSTLDADGATLSMVLATAGPYSLFASDTTHGTTGGYGLFLERLNNPCTASTLSCRVPVDATLTPAGDIDAFRLAQVTQGESVIVRMTRTTGTMVERLELFAANGTSLGASTSTGGGAAVTAVLAFAGPYTLLARDSTNTTEGAYRLTLQRNGGACFQFTDDPAVPGSTVIRAQHFSELRDSIDQLRGRCGLGSFDYSESLVGGLTVRAQQISELRTALDHAYDCRGRPRPTYSDPLLVPGQTTIRAVHLQELRAAVIAIE